MVSLLYEKEKVRLALQDFKNATGVNIALIQEDFSRAKGLTPLFTTQESKTADYCEILKSIPCARDCCIQCDREILGKCRKSGKMEMHVCHAGLVDVAIPVLYGKKVLCYILLGQMKQENSFLAFRDHIVGLGADVEKMQKAYDKLPLYDADKIDSVTRLAVMLAKYIMFENMLVMGVSRNVEKAVVYIDEHLSEDISVEKLSKAIGVSKSVLYNNFHDVFGCTVHEYISEKRIEKSLEYLLCDDLSMEEIAQKIGFSGAAYYGAVFKKKKGMSPLKFKKEKLKK